MPAVAQRVSDILLGWHDHPAEMVRDLFAVEPDAWQEQVLEEFPHHPAQVMMCCKGPGKTTVLAWLCWNYLLTRGPSTKIGAASYTAKNLADNLWAEMAKWQARSALLMDQFLWKGERIEYRGTPEAAADWFMTAKSWPQSANETQLGSAMAGLWADHVLFVLDECGEIPIGVLRTAEAALGTASLQGREAHVVLAGNTSSVEGCLYYAAVTHAARWKRYHVTADPDDPKRTPRISAEDAARDIAEYGRDNPWVKINILAEFPTQGVNQLISADAVRECLGRHLAQSAYNWAPKVLGGDVADYGDDSTVLFPRQGPVYFSPVILHHMDPVQIAGHWMGKANQWGADSIQIDATGGYGSGPIAIMKDHGYIVVPVYFSGEPIDPKFYNKRAEIWWNACEHLKQGASLPDDCPELVHELSSATYSYKGDKILLEDKKLMKARLGRSPDRADALCCTHAYPVAVTRSTREALFPFGVDSNVSKSKTDYDPISRD